MGSHDVASQRERAIARAGAATGRRTLPQPASPGAAPGDNIGSVSDIWPRHDVGTSTMMYPSNRRSCPEMIAPVQSIDVLFVILPHSLLLDIAGPAEAFRLANQHRERSVLPPRFRLRFA